MNLQIIKALEYAREAAKPRQPNVLNSGHILTINARDFFVFLRFDCINLKAFYRLSRFLTVCVKPIEKKRVVCYHKYV